ncbi:MAG: ribonuclease Z [Candidatus Cloacimonetes bacterium]|nr:ribonuclease Z [Candidatus Cloacimonadota bacterium]
MQFTFLGTSAAAPTRKRFLSSLAFRFTQNPDWLLFDCGEGAQCRLLYTRFSFAHLKHIFISHLHGDHVFGLFGLLATRDVNGITSPLNIYAPPGSQQLLETVFKQVDLNLHYTIHYHISAPGKLLLETPEAKVTSWTMKHNPECYGYLIREHDKPGRFDIEKARRENIPPGPVFADLKSGKTITLSDGRTIDGNLYTGKPITGRKVFIAGDNSDPDSLIPVIKSVDLLIHEATHLQEDRDRSEKGFQHSTALQTATAAQTAGVRNLILTHFSPRYAHRAKGVDIRDMLEEAVSVYKGNCLLAGDLHSYILNRKGELLPNPQ